MITIVIAEDHDIVRDGLKLLLSGQHDFQLVGEAGDGVQAIRLVEQLDPQILILDLSIPRLHGLEVLRQLRGEKTRVIVLSMHHDESYVIEAFQHRAAGYVLKKSSGAELIAAIRKVCRGERFLSPPMSRRLMDVRPPGAKEAALDPYDVLTNRERTILQMSAEGLSSAEIALRLFISSRTVETHRTNLMRKLGLRSRTELVRFAIRRKIIAA